MAITKFIKTWTRRFSFRGMSMQQRLPLLICVLLLSIIVTFSWTSYIGVKKAALKVGQDRLQSLSEQLSSMFGQSAQTLVTATRTAANRPSIKKHLMSGGKDSSIESQIVIQKLRADSTWVLSELLNAKHETIIRSGNASEKLTASLDSILSASALYADSSKVGKIYFVNDSMYYPVIAAVTEKNQVMGYVVRWRIMRSASKAIEQFSQLIGTNASLKIGNADGSLWTDMINPVLPPPLDTSNTPGFLNYSNEQGKQVIGSAQPVAFSQWRVLVEFNQSTVLEPAKRFLIWIIPVGTALVAIGIFIAWLMSRNITRPLKKLTTAATEIASGNYSPNVEVDRNDELGKLARAFSAMTIQVRHSKTGLEKKVKERTAQLETANSELEAFSYSVSHDLRAPLRAISGYAMILKEDYGKNLDDEANRITGRIIANASKMGQLIDDLISFSHMGGKEAEHFPVDMKKLAETCMTELLQQVPEKKYQVKIHPLPACYGDQNLIRQVWLNLISNAIKYSSKTQVPCIEIGCTEGVNMHTYFICDNGVGFEMKHAHKLFGVFQRLHSQDAFEGTGIGLAFVKRIINKHNGQISAEGAPGEGARFSFTLPALKKSVNSIHPELIKSEPHEH